MKRTPRIEILSTGRNQFVITNGFDEIHAAFIYGSGSKESRTKAHWDLTMDGHTKSLFVSKTELIDILTAQLTEPMKKPLTKEKALALAERDGRVHGIVQAKLSELFELMPGANISMLAARLCEPPITDIQYAIVAAGDEDICLRVSGTLMEE